MKPLTQWIDHTLLKADVTSADIAKLCDEAKKFKFAAVCVNPANVKQAKLALKDSGVKVATVVGFPLGANLTDTKVFETLDSIRAGADEIDMVINIGKIKSGDWTYVEDDIRRVVEGAGTRLVKVILETSLLMDDEIVRACELSVKAGARFVKTSTGFSTGGARPEHVRLMRATVGKLFGVKASGGIRDRDTFMAMVDAGANRIGTSSGVVLLNEGRAESGY